MVKIQKDKVIFSRDTWEELKKNPVYSELIEDIEDRMELEQAISENDKSGNKLINFDDYDNRRMKKMNRPQKNVQRKKVKKISV
jgi:hypothetical protein